MKKGNITGGFSALVIGIMLMSGCTTTEPAGMTTVITPVPLMVNETFPVTTTSAAPANNTPLQMFNETCTETPIPTPAVPVSTAAVTIPHMVYETIAVTPELSGTPETDAMPVNDPVFKETLSSHTYSYPSPVEGVHGSLSILTGGLGDVSVFIARGGANVRPADDDISGNFAEDQHSGYTRVNILPDGSSEFVSLPPGNYIAYLPDKNGGMPENQSFIINANSITTISFKGNSYRIYSGPPCWG